MRGRQLLVAYGPLTERVVRVDGEEGPRLPRDATVDGAVLVGLLDSVHNACAPCRYHDVDCVLNVLYAHVEKALERRRQKPAGQKPGPWCIGGRR